MDHNIIDCPTKAAAALSHKNVAKNETFIPGRSETLTSLTDDQFEAMMVKEMENLPRGSYLEKLRKGDLDMSLRRECVDWICKAHAHYGFTEQCFALAVNSYDRFMSVYELPRGSTWANQLLAVACLSLAAKMEEVEVPLIVDLQVGKPKAIFDGKTIQKMELLVLNTLGWKLHAYTPYTFVDYFLIKIGNDQHTFRPLIAKAVEIILSTIKGIDFLEFRPCEIAAAVALFVLGVVEAVDIDKALSFFKQVEKARVLKCIEMIHNSKLIGPSSSPNGVLEAACMTCKTYEKTVDSGPSSYNSQESERGGGILTTQL